MVNTRTRIISAVIALLIVIPLIYLGGLFFQMGMLIIATLAYKELIDLKKSHKDLPYMMVILGLFSLFLIVLSRNNMQGVSNMIIALVLIMMLLPIVFYKKDGYTSKEAFYLIGIIFFLGFVLNIFIQVRNMGLNNFIFLLLIPTFNDIFAFLIGSKIGKHKITAISPNKSWEGSLAGLATALVCCTIFYKIFIGSITLKLIIMIIVLSIMGQLGDIVLSKIKRENDIKDFSNLMPGHGGILDRIDSLIFVFLTYIFMYYL